MVRWILSVPLLAALLALPAQAAPQNNSGLTFASQDELRGVPLAATPFSGAELPKKVDLSGNMPPPGNQGNQNSCVGWATAYALKSYQEKVEERRNLAPNGKVDPKAVFSPAFIYNQINNGRDGGSTFIDALNLLSNHGAVSLADMPYTDRDFRKAPPNHLINQARRYRIDYWRQVNIRDLKEVKAQLNAGYPVLIGALIDEGFVNTRGNAVWKQSRGQSLGGHAMALVGYDDSRQAFKLINSWGTGWGEKGFGWVDYKFFPQVVREGYVAKDAVNGKAPPTSIDPQQDPDRDPDYQPEDPDFRNDPSFQDNPEPAADDAEFDIGEVEHNLPAPAPEYREYGPFMKLTGPVRIPAEAGQHMQVVVRFYYDNGKGGKGKPVPTRVPEVFSVVDEGIAATGTPQLELPMEGLDDQWYAFIPYNAFDLPAGRVNLIAEPMLYVDNFGIRTGTLIPFWVETSGKPTNKPNQQQQTNTAQNAALQAMQSFSQAMQSENYATAWALLSEESKQGFSELLAEELEESVSTARAMFDRGDDILMEHFWPTVREGLESESWFEQTYRVQSTQGNQVLLKSSPSGLVLIMKLEGGRWKLGFMESSNN